MVRIITGIPYSFMSRFKQFTMADNSNRQFSGVLELYLNILPRALWLAANHPSPLKPSTKDPTVCVKELLWMVYQILYVKWVTGRISQKRCKPSLIRKQSYIMNESSYI